MKEKKEILIETFGSKKVLRINLKGEITFRENTFWENEIPKVYFEIDDNLYRKNDEKKIIFEGNGIIIQVGEVINDAYLPSNRFHYINGFNKDKYIIRLYSHYISGEFAEDEPLENYYKLSIYDSENNKKIYSIENLFCLHYKKHCYLKQVDCPPKPSLRSSRCKT